MLNKEKNFVSVVAYLHNSEKEIPAFLDYIVEELERNFEKSEVIFVNDASEDNSVSVIKEYLEKRKCNFMTNIINMSSYHGLEASMLAGVDLAIGDFVYEFDSIAIDYSKKFFMEVYYEALKGNDIVAATPAGNVEFPVSLFYYFYNKFRLSKGGGQTKLQRETFRIVSRRAINRVQTLGKSVPYRKVMYQNCGLGYKNLVYERTTKDKKNYRDKERKSRENLALDTLLMFTNAVQKVSMFLSMFFLIFTIGVGVYVVAVFFSGNKPVEGWTPMMGFMAAAFTGIFMLLTILLKYMAVLFEITFNKKRYLISSIEKING